MCLVLKHLSCLGLLNTGVDASKEQAGGVLDILQSTLQRSLCDVKWETRDSAVEFVSLLVSNLKGEFRLSFCTFSWRKDFI